MQIKTRNKERQWSYGTNRVPWRVRRRPKQTHVGLVGAIASTAYIVETGGTGSAVGGTSALTLSFAEMGIGAAQMVDAFKGGNNPNLQESGTFVGYSMRQKNMVGAEYADAVVQFVPGMLTGGNIWSLYKGPNTIKNSKNTGEAVYNTLSLLDAWQDTRALWLATVKASNSSNTNSSNTTATSSNVSAPRTPCLLLPK